MADKPFRILLDLTDVQTESYKYVWIYVSPRELKTIADFKLSLCRKINFEKKDFNLFVRDGLLLDEETILVLREDDSIKVQYESMHQAPETQLSEHKEQKKSSRKRNHSGCANEITTSCFNEISPVSIKKRKTKNSFINKDVTEMQLEDTVNKRKKHKKLSNSLTLDNQIDSGDVIDIQNSDVVHKKKKNKKNVSLESNTNFNNEVNSVAFVSFPDDDELLKENSVENFEKIQIVELPSSSIESSNDLNSLKFTNNDTFNEESQSKFNESTTFEKSTNNCPKKKRKRHKKRKPVNISAFKEVPDIVNYSTEFVSFNNDTSNNSKRKHILYNSPPHKNVGHEIPEIILDSNSNKEIDMSSATFTVPGTIRNVEADTQKEYPRISTPSQSKLCIDPNWHVSLVQDEKLVPYTDENKSFKVTKFVSSDGNYLVGDKIRCDENESFKVTKFVSSGGNYLEGDKIRCDENKSFKVTKFDKSDPLISTDDMLSDQNFKDFENKKDPSYANFPSLNAVPEIGTRIAYKMLELGETYSPEVSKYKEGIVKAINEVTDEIEIELIQHEIKPGRTGKFENLENDQVPFPEIKKWDIVTWGMLIEPKLLLKS